MFCIQITICNNFNVTQGIDQSHCHLVFFYKVSD